VLSNGGLSPHHHTLGAAREVLHPTAVELDSCSLGLEDEERLVATFEEIEEASPFCVVSDRQGKVLAADDVPSGAAVLGEAVVTQAVLDLSGDQFVKRMLFVDLLTDTDNVLDDLEGHVSESDPVLGHGEDLSLFYFF